jgi:hypothetical protein
VNQFGVVICTEGIDSQHRREHNVTLHRFGVMVCAEGIDSQHRREHNVTMNQCGVVVCAEGIDSQHGREHDVTMNQRGVVVCAEGIDSQHGTALSLWYSPVLLEGVRAEGIDSAGDMLYVAKFMLQTGLLSYFKAAEPVDSHIQ